jgi:hypothetical protein
MRIPINFPDAERLVASLGLSITDYVAEAGCDAEKTLLCLREAAAFAHVQARLLDRLSEAVAGEVPITVPEGSDSHYLRLAVAARNVTPLKTTVAESNGGGDAA